MLAQRPMIIPAGGSVLTLKVSSKNAKERPLVAVDGQMDYFLNKNDTVTISVSSQSLNLIVNPNRKYFEVLREKLKWGERG